MSSSYAWGELQMSWAETSLTPPSPNIQTFETGPIGNVDGLSPQLWHCSADMLPQQAFVYLQGSNLCSATGSFHKD